MQIPINSNLISGAFTLGEVLVAVLLSRLITVCLECWNVYQIYDCRKHIFLRSSGLDAVSFHGLTSRTARRIAFLLSGSVIVLMAVGGYAIAGVSAGQFKEEEVRALVTQAEPQQLFNFKEHVSVEPGSMAKVSGAYMLLSETTTCYRANLSHLSIYQAISNDEVELNRITWDIAAEGPNFTCLAKEEGFQDSLVKTFPRFFEAPEESCQVFFDPTNVSSQVPTRVSPLQNASCPTQLLETWCLKSTVGTTCIASLEDKTGFSIAQLVHDSRTDMQYKAFSDLHVNERLKSDDVQSAVVVAAALSYIEGELFPSEILTMLYMRVQENVTVKRLAQDRRVTEVNVTLLLLGLVPSLLTTAVTGLFALYAWTQLIYLKGRRGYNRFSSVMDMLSCAATETFQEGGCRYRRHASVKVGISQYEPRVGPLKEQPGEGGRMFREEEIFGRTRFLHD